MTKRRKSITTYKHGIAAYPIEYRGYVVSPEKICIQFNKLQCKTRINKDAINELTKKPGYWEMPIAHSGSDIDFLAVGVPIYLHKTMQLELLKAYEEHINKHGKEMYEFLKFYHTSLGQLLERLND